MRTFITLAVISIWLAFPANAQADINETSTPREVVLAKVVARAWIDPAYKAKLLSDPHAALAEFGLKVRDGTRLKVVEDTIGTKHFVLPVAPENVGELSSDELEKVAGDFYEIPKNKEHNTRQGLAVIAVEKP